MKKISGVILMLLLMTMFSLTLNIKPTRAEWTGTVYIRANGSIDPPDAPIVTYDKVTYTLTGNITNNANGIVCERNDIIIDGAGFTVHGTGGYPYKGIDLSGRNNVTIKNIIIKGFYYGICFEQSFNNNITGNNIYSFITLRHSSNNSITRNNITNYQGIYLYNSSNNIIFENNFTFGGLFVTFSYQNFVKNNTVNGRPLVYLEGMSNYTVDDAGQVILVRCNKIKVEGLVLSRTSDSIQLHDVNNSVISGNSITNNWGYGIGLYDSSNNTIIGNNITDNQDGIKIDHSSSNIISTNNIANNGCGVCLVYSSNNSIVRNIFTNDGLMVLDSSGNVVDDNFVNGKPIVYFECASGLKVREDAGQVILVNCDGIYVENLNLSYVDIGIELWETKNTIISGNNITNNWYGVYMDSSFNNIISGNNITNNLYSMRFYSSFNNSISANNITNNWFGMSLYYCFNNKFYHNNFIGNNRQVEYYSSGYVNFWDDGYPSGGNYWSNYASVDLHSGPFQNVTGSDGIGDTPYTIDANNTDRYPLIAPFKAFEASVWNGITYNVDVISNSTVSDFRFNVDNKSVSFNVTGDDLTIGFCRVTIPKSLLWVDDGWTILVGSQSVTDYARFEDENYTYLYFTYTHSTKTVTIKGTHVIPEFPSAIILTIFMPIATILIVFERKRRKFKCY
jgi:parallel beta-helix repeat protein